MLPYTDPSLMIVAPSCAGVRPSRLECLSATSGADLLSPLDGKMLSVSNWPRIAWLGHRTLRDPTQATNPTVPHDAPTNVRMQLFLGADADGNVYRFLRDGSAMVLGRVAGAVDVRDMTTYLPRTTVFMLACAGQILLIERAPSIAAKTEKWQFEDGALWSVKKLIDVADPRSLKTHTDGTLYIADAATSSVLKVAIDLPTLSAASSVSLAIGAKPLALDVMSDGGVAVLCDDGRLRIIKPDGAVAALLTTKPTSTGSVSVDKAGVLGPVDQAFVTRDGVDAFLVDGTTVIDRAAMFGGSLASALDKTSGFYFCSDQAVGLINYSDGRVPVIVRPAA